MFCEVSLVFVTFALSDTDVDFCCLVCAVGFVGLLVCVLIVSVALILLVYQIVPFFADLLMLSRLFF